MAASFSPVVVAAPVLPALRASLRFCCSSCFLLRPSSISWRIFSLYGNRLGIPGSFLSFDFHCGFFLASFLALRCFEAEDFSILCRRRVGVRFDLGSVGEEQIG